MDSRFRNCIEEGKLVKIEIQMDLVGKEVQTAEFDLRSAEKSMGEGNPKWATVQAYYSMFHTAKALVYRKGYREKSHACLSIALRALYENVMDARHFEHFRDCMNLRQDADYGMIYSDKSARTVVDWATEFLKAAREALKKQPPVA